MKMAYADPPYIGQAKRLYKCPEVDHRELITRLCDEYPDGWALSASSTSLQTIHALCPSDVRTMAWVKPWCSFKPGVGVAFAWEPVIVRGGRKRTRKQPTIRDWVSASCALGRGLAGAKPDDFCFWLFEVLNLRPDDDLDDLFPGTGAVTRAWEIWRRQARLWEAKCCGPAQEQPELALGMQPKEGDK